MGADLSKELEEVDRWYEEKVKKLKEEEEESDRELELALGLESGEVPAEGVPDLYVRPIDDPDYKGPVEDPEELKKYREGNIKRLTSIIEDEERLKREDEEDAEYLTDEELFERDLPKDPENWKEEDIQELWGDAPSGFTQPGWDPYWVDEQDVAAVESARAAGKNPITAPFYVPYRQHYPVIPDNHHDIQTPRDVIEELDRTEEFLKWKSFVFEDGSTYEGTVWDDCAHGKGVYVSPDDLVRYEGEWFQNTMEGHGVAEVDIPLDQPIPGSKHEEQMRKEGALIIRDFMDPEERRWLDMDIEDSIRLAGGFNETPWYENDDIVKLFGSKPEKGHYRYAGQWKHGRFHGCGVYQVNLDIITGRFYFGQLLGDEDPLCLEDECWMHAGLGETAAAKARMFVNKPDGMVREQRGPYNDPQHPYMYEEDDVWMAPGFIHQFYEVPDDWKRYVREVDKEREMWLNAFNKSPLRLPGPSELEYAWQNFEPDEFVFICDDPEPNYDNPSAEKDAMILHIPTGRLINSVPDEQYGVRLFWQPHLEEGEELDLSKVEFIPSGYDEFFDDQSEELSGDENIVVRALYALDKILLSFVDKSTKWCEEKQKELDLMEEAAHEERELRKAEMKLEEDMKQLEKEMMEEEKKKARMGLPEEDISKSDKAVEIEISPAKEHERELEEEEEGEEDDDDDVEAASFGDVKKENENREKSGNSRFAMLSSRPAFSDLMVPSKWQKSFAWKGSLNTSMMPRSDSGRSPSFVSVTFPNATSKRPRLRIAKQASDKFRMGSKSSTQLKKDWRCFFSPSHKHADEAHNCDLGSVLSLHRLLLPTIDAPMLSH